MQLIDADALKECIKKRLLNGMIIGWLFSIIDAAPTIEADPVKHGRWVNNLEQAWQAFNCSICGESTDDTCMGKPRANYCPNCGAKMDLEETE